VNTQAVFDHLAVCKGPNLGTYFTLCCPYTILAHYNELDAVEEYGVSRWLLRVSIGTEPVEELWLRFQTALQHVTM
jgi:cystathionine gamma-synthase